MADYIFLLRCADQKGIVAAVSQTIFSFGGNIRAANQHSSGAGEGAFFMRVEFSTEEVPADALRAAFCEVSERFGGTGILHERRSILRMGILVSRPQHCLADLLYRWRSGELRVDIPFVIGNHDDARDLVEQFRIPFRHIPATKEDKREEEILAHALPESDFLVLARYMQVFSPDFLARYGRDIINIHHGFLPSFKGPDPYRQAFLKGVKVIGATAHFVTADLDNGPIIAQSVAPVSHEDTYPVLVRKGKDLEKEALASAVEKYLDYRIIRLEKTTIVF